MTPLRFVGSQQASQCLEQKKPKSRRLDVPLVPHGETSGLWVQHALPKSDRGHCWLAMLPDSGRLARLS
jgi:hypothetical protein